MIHIAADKFCAVSQFIEGFFSVKQNRGQYTTAGAGVFEPCDRVYAQA
jgi:hypothetical protein